MATQSSTYMMPPNGSSAQSSAQHGQPNQGQFNQSQSNQGFYGQGQQNPPTYYQVSFPQGQPNQGQFNQSQSNQGFYGQSQPHLAPFYPQGHPNPSQYQVQPNQNSFAPSQPNQLNQGQFNQGQPAQAFYAPVPGQPTLGTYTQANQSQPNQAPYVQFQPTQGYYAPGQIQGQQGVQPNQGYYTANQGPYSQMQQNQPQFVQAMQVQPIHQAQPKAKPASKKQEKNAAALAELMKILDWIINTTVTHNNEIIMRKVYSKDRALKELLEIDNQWTSFLQTSSLLPKDISKDALLKSKKIDCMRAMTSYLRLLRKYGSKDRGSRISKLRIQLGRKFKLKSSITGKVNQKIKNQTNIDISNQDTTKRRNVYVDNGEDEEEEDEDDDEEDDNGAPSYMQ